MSQDRSNTAPNELTATIADASLSERQAEQINIKAAWEAHPSKEFTVDELEYLVSSLEQGAEFEVQSLDMAEAVAVAILRYSIERDYGPDSKSYRPYHNVLHSDMIDRGTSQLFDSLATKVPHLLLGVSEEEFKSGGDSSREKLATLRSYNRILAWAHDVVQNATPSPAGDKLIRARGIEEQEGNEAYSAGRLAHLLDRFLYRDGRKVFEQITPDRAYWDVAATYPTIDFGLVKGLDGEYVKGLMFVQPYLTERSSLTAVCLALCDSKEAQGVYGADVSVASGDAEFRELNIGISGLAKSDPAKLDTLTKAEACATIISWLNSQYAYIMHQKSDCDRILANYVHDDMACAVLREHFKSSQFEDNARVARERAGKWSRACSLLVAESRVTAFEDKFRGKRPEEISPFEDKFSDLVTAENTLRADTAYSSPDRITDLNQAFTLLMKEIGY